MLDENSIRLGNRRPGFSPRTNVTMDKPPERAPDEPQVGKQRVDQRRCIPLLRSML